MTQKASLNIEMPGVDFAGMAREAIAVKLTESMIGSDEAITKIVAAANALYGKDNRLNAPEKVARNSREIAWLKDLRSTLLSGAGTESDGIEVYVKPMELADNRTDYFVAIKVGDREVTPHVFRDEYKAAYHVALYNWLLNGSGEEPELMDFNENDWPARITRPSDPSPGSDVSLSAPVGEPVARGGAVTDWWAESIKLYRQNKSLRKALQEQHDWHLAQGEKDFGEGVTLNMADEYSDSGMCERTTAALDAVLPSGIEGYEKWKEQTAHPPAPAVGPEVREKTIRAIMERLSGCSFPLRVGAWHEETASLIFDQVAAALTRPLGGFVQGSIATKQATDETAASVLSEALDDVSSVYDEMCIQFSGVHADDRMDSLMLRLHSALKAFGREQVGTICAHEDGCPPFGGPCPSCEPRYQYSALAQLTKTPSADHDAGNLRGLAEPHHQPHALSQAAAFVAWAMREGPWEGGDLDGGTLQDKAEELGLIIKTAYEPDIHGPCDYGAEPGDDWFVLHPDIKAAANLPAPPVLENTPRDSSESTTGGVV